MPTQNLKTLFTHHPEAVGETYLEHFGAATRYSGKFFAAGFCALVHAFLPFLFEKTASTMVRRMVADMDRRAAQPQPQPSLNGAEQRA